MYGLHNSLLAKSGKRKALADILTKASTMLTQKNDCHAYIVSMDRIDPDRIWVTEVWDSKQSHDDALSDTGVRLLIAQGIELLREMPQPGQELDVVHI